MKEDELQPSGLCWNQSPGTPVSETSGVTCGYRWSQEITGGRELADRFLSKCYDTTHEWW